MSADESPSHPLPVATAIEKPGTSAQGARTHASGFALDSRVAFVGGGVALIGVVVFAMFLWMVPSAAARELQAACRGLHAESELKPALCPGGKACSAPVPAPDFTAEDMTGKQVKLSDFRGKVVLINFWASWCGLCKTEKPLLNQMAREMANNDDFVVLALASDRTWADAMTALLETLAPSAAPEGKASRDDIAAAYRKALPNGTPFKVLLDPPSGDENIGKITASWGITAVPESALIDRQGNIRAYFGNKREWQSNVAETCLRSVIEAN
ncbi:MAG TPA: TlpA disulfide reductase family protein [Kofleriaceae bacterium]|jgi:thiol-disulfide isomerase/thioredoxin